MLYFKVSFDETEILDVIEREVEFPAGSYNTKETSRANKKPFLVPVTVTKPTFDPATEKLGEPVDSVNGTRVYPVVPLTDAEIAKQGEDELVNDLPSILRMCVETTQAIIDANVLPPNAMSADVIGKLSNLKTVTDKIKDKKPV